MTQSLDKLQTEAVVLEVLYASQGGNTEDGIEGGTGAGNASDDGGSTGGNGSAVPGDRAGQA
ncbi:MAG: hypothetical protein RMJ19_13075 [Gemmatales bacterium]|nr:hypothetical protein [Gemmatales bacterium]MDW8176601.1 hypothetical protein [Gemmatales bacterium]